MSKENTRKAVEPKFHMRQQQKMFHHLFKTSIAEFLKNTSWVKGVVTIDNIVHVHHFHSCDSQGFPQTQTTHVGGHYHEVTWGLGPDGVPFAKCGPPMRKRVKNTRMGGKVILEQVSYLDEVNLTDDGQPKKVIDNHRHEMLYQGTDELTLESVQKIQQANAQLISSQTPIVPDDVDVADIDRGE